MKKAYMNWSGGKDSALCLHQVLQEKEFSVARLLTSVNAVHNRISMHGVRRELLLAQCQSLGIPLSTIELPEQPGMQEYETAMQQQVEEMKALGCDYALFGDIFLEDLRSYREQKLASLSVQCAFPLWKKPTKALAEEFIELGFKAIVVCINNSMLDKSFCGRLIDHSFLQDLPANVDPCGENGEYHSFVFDGPLFPEPVKYTKGEIVYRQYEAPKTEKQSAAKMDQASEIGFYFCDLLPVDQ